MYRLKQRPEDFIVEEIAEFPLKDSGNYLLLKIRKTGLNTEDVARLLAEKFKVSRKSIGYAGTKDKHAITVQHFSVKGVKREEVENITIDGVEIAVVGYLSEALALGMLIGNKFTITLRNLEGGEELTLPKQVPNYYDEQRFQQQNARVGEALVRKEFKTACELVATERRYQKRIEEHLARSPNDYVGAIRILPVPLLKIYLHAFQSRLWNEILSRYLEDTADSISRLKYSQGTLVFPGINDNIENKSVPLPGFGDDCKDKQMEKYLADILKMNSLTPMDYVIKQLPNLSLEGTERAAFMEVKDFSIGGFEDDELNEGKKKVVVSFSLGKGSYATMVVKSLFQRH